MKACLSAALVAGALMFGGAAIAQSTDDARWLAQCLSDNATQRTAAGVAIADSVKAAYCTCMISQMSDNETRSVSAWERANPAIARQCSTAAGWN